MSLISTEQLHAFAPACNAAAWAPALDAAAQKYGIVKPLAIAHWMGQMGEETGGFISFAEDLYYTSAVRLAEEIYPRIFMPGLKPPYTAAQIKAGIAAAVPYLGNSQKLANKVYANLYGNGNEASGDGFRYRGQGPMQITFKDAYADAQKAIGGPYLAHPELLQSPQHGSLTSAWFFAVYKAGCMEAALNDNVAEVTLKLAGSEGALGTRQAQTNAAKEIWLKAA